MSPTPDPTKDKDAAEKEAAEKKKTADEGSDADKELDYKAETEKWKALSRKHEGQAKANAEAAKKLAEMEEADKTELQKAVDKALAADKAAASAQGELLRLRIAMRKGLTEAQAKRLVGETEEEIEADAKDLLESFSQKKDAGQDGSTPTRPKERLRSGAVPDEEPDEMDPQKLAAAVPRL